MKHPIAALAALLLSSCGLFEQLRTPEEEMVLADQKFAQLLQTPGTSYHEWIAANEELSEAERLLGVSAFQNWLLAVKKAEESVDVAPMIGSLYTFPLGILTGDELFDALEEPGTPEPEEPTDLEDPFDVFPELDMR